MGIRIVEKTPGSPPKKTLAGYRKYRTRKEQNIRKNVEGEFGQGKNGYNLDHIRARKKDTLESWISTILLVMNLTKLMKVAIEYGDFLALSVWGLLRTVIPLVVLHNGIPINNNRTVSVLENQ